MIPAPPSPLLYQLNTRVWLTQRGRELGRPATLDDIPDEWLDELAAQGFDWLWMLSVWTTGPAGAAVSRTHAGWRAEFQRTLPDLTDEDIDGSGFAIVDYTVSPALGGPEALKRLRQRLRNRGVQLMLDFVPNHMALDHPWATTHPERFIAAIDQDWARTPENAARIVVGREERRLAHGRDPYFPGWPDTLQLNYADPGAAMAMRNELLRVASQCDGVRCDMAMLLLPDVFQRTWGLEMAPFWPDAIDAVRAEHPHFVFLAEVYWDLEWTLQQQGFDFTYDKRLYDRLRLGDVGPVRGHLQADLAFQRKLARFLENHDEPRAASTFPVDKHRAAAVITYLIPGLRFFQHGQLTGARAHISPHLIRGPEEPVNGELQSFYSQLLPILKQNCVRYGEWTLVDCQAAWQSNWTSTCVVASRWTLQDEELLAIVNYSDHRSQCRIDLNDWPGGSQGHHCVDLLSGANWSEQNAAAGEQYRLIDLGPWEAVILAPQTSK